ncbi:magnesium transporter [Candidatus Uhrbacteria bacterium]|nr:magnesium transporter [Candidatus Uhrbacteria bacterium]
MIFLSYLLGARVRDAQGSAVGTIIDALVDLRRSEDVPPLVGLLCRRSAGEEAVCLSPDSLESWGPDSVILDARIDDAIITTPTGPGVVALKESVMDKQIVDLSGLRVVRVNDVQFSRVRSVMSLVALDISTRGLLRRMGFSHPRWDRLLKPNFLEWKDVSLVENQLHLTQHVEDMVKLHPADIANLIEHMNIRHGSVVLQSLDQATAARVLEEVQPEIQTILVKSLGPERAASIMQKMSVDELVDLMQALPNPESGEIMRRLPGNEKTEDLRSIIKYDEDTAGGLMTTEFVSAQPNLTVRQAVDLIRKVSTIHHSLPFVYIVDQREKFLGVVSTRRLLIADPDQTLAEVMKLSERLPTAGENDRLMDVATLMTKYNLFTVAVLDGKGKLLGVVTADDIMRSLIPNA